MKKVLGRIVIVLPAVILQVSDFFQKMRLQKY